MQIILFILSLIFIIPTYGFSFVAWIIFYYLSVKYKIAKNKAIKKELSQTTEGRKLLAIAMYADQLDKFRLKPYPEWCKKPEYFIDPNSDIYHSFLRYFLLSFSSNGNLSILFPSLVNNREQLKKIHSFILKNTKNFLFLTACAEYQGLDKNEQLDLAIEEYCHLYFKINSI